MRALSFISWLKKIDPVPFFFFILTFICSMVGLTIYIPYFGVHPLEPVVTGIFVFIVALAIAAGYHRYFAHKTYHCHPLLKVILLIIGAAGFQQSALVWASDHRMHHRYVDTDKDPYSMSKGFWWAHIGWVFAKGHPDRSDLMNKNYDLTRDPWVLWQHKYLLWIGIALSVGIPLSIGFLIGRPFGMLLWAGLLRIVITNQTTFTINSIAHKFGTQPYTDKNSAKDVWWLAPLLCGETYHNYHHCFQSDYRNGIRWYHWDPAKWALWLLSYTPLVSKLCRTPNHKILEAQIEMDFKRLKSKMHQAPSDYWLPLQVRILNMHASLMESIHGYAHAKKAYQQFKQGFADRSREAMTHAQIKLHEAEDNLKNHYRAWRDAIRHAGEGLATTLKPVPTQLFSSSRSSP